MSKRFVVGTRTSALALWQTHRVIEMLQSARAGVEYETRHFTTRGDKTLDKPLPEIGGKGLFTQELEEALRRGEIDAAVHSLKDLPVEDSEGLTLGAISTRAGAGDCLVAREGWTLTTLPAGAIVGTSSIRRQAQILAVRPDLDVRSIRGNVETRIRKVHEGQYHATVMARAGLERLGLAENVTEYFEFDVMLPAPGQGALAVQCRAGDTVALDLLSTINDPGDRSAVTAEREFLAGLGGGCSAPVGAYACRAGGPGSDELEITAVVGSPDGKNLIRVEGKGVDPVELGRRVAKDAIGRGAATILESIAKPEGTPLAGRRIVVTRALERSASFCRRLEALGAEPVVVPAIRIVPVEDDLRLRRTIAGMDVYDWAVFTSANGVEYFWRALEKIGADGAILERVKIAAVGTSTDAALRSRGVTPDLVPATFTGEAIAHEMNDVDGKRVCLLRARIAGNDLPRILSERGARVDEVAVYDNEPADIDEDAVAELRRGVDMVTFTSGSTVYNFVAALRKNSDNEKLLTAMRYACIGPVTAESAREAGIPVALVAEVYTTEGLIDALVRYFNKENKNDG